MVLSVCKLVLLLRELDSLLLSEFENIVITRDTYETPLTGKMVCKFVSRLRLEFPRVASIE